MKGFVASPNLCSKSRCIIRIHVNPSSTAHFVTYGNDYIFQNVSYELLKSPLLRPNNLKILVQRSGIACSGVDHSYGSRLRNTI